jgi:translation initiation factor IF-3
VTNEPRINDRIRAREVRLIGADGSQLGIKSLPEALSLARELELDLVEVADKAIPPVVRIMDFGKYKYEASQRVKESRKHQASNALKEMKYRPKIGKADFDTKTRLVEKFLGEGHKVKVTIMFRGREVYHPELGRRILDNVAEAVGHVGRVEVASKLDGRNMTMVLTPDRKAQAAHTAQRRRSDVPDGGGPSGDLSVPSAPGDETGSSGAATTGGSTSGATTSGAAGARPGPAPRPQADRPSPNGGDRAPESAPAS